MRSNSKAGKIKTAIVYGLDRITGKVSRNIPRSFEIDKGENPYGGYVRLGSTELSNLDETIDKYKQERPYLNIEPMYVYNVTGQNQKAGSLSLIYDVGLRKQAKTKDMVIIYGTASDYGNY